MGRQIVVGGVSEAACRLRSRYGTRRNRRRSRLPQRPGIGRPCFLVIMPKMASAIRHFAKGRSMRCAVCLVWVDTGDLLPAIEPWRRRLKMRPKSRCRSRRTRSKSSPFERQARSGKDSAATRQAALQIHRSRGGFVLEVSAGERAGLAAADRAAGAEKHRPAIRAVSAGRIAVRAVRPAAVVLPGEERLRGVQRAHVRDGTQPRLARLHGDAAANSLSRWPDRRGDPQSLTRRPTGTFRTAGWFAISRRSWSARRRRSSNRRSIGRRFSSSSYDLKVEIPVEQHDDVYIPLAAMTLIESQLQDGDFVNVVQGAVKIVAKKDDDDDGYEATEE